MTIGKNKLWFDWCWSKQFGILIRVWRVKGRSARYLGFDLDLPFIGINFELVRENESSNGK